jgi:hypothetical protein
MNSTFNTLSSFGSAAPARRPVSSSFTGWMARAGSAMWKAMAASGQARAQRHLLEYANSCESLQPELAKELRAAVRHYPAA